MTRINKLRAHGPPTVRVTEHGPYLAEGVVEIRQRRQRRPTDAHRVVEKDAAKDRPAVAHACPVAEDTTQ